MVLISFLKPILYIKLFWLIETSNYFYSSFSLLNDKLHVPSLSYLNVN